MPLMNIYNTVLLITFEFPDEPISKILKLSEKNNAINENTK
jgi:hypothetical protein